MTGSGSGSESDRGAGLVSVGDVLAGKYRVERILGVGGMGMVVAATHLELEHRVAIKFMLPAALESAEAGMRFLREARAAGRLTSEHICRVIDVGRFDSGAPYIVMEHLEGYDLGTLRKRRGPFRIVDAIDYVVQACEGLAEAHALGIIHRDLKPDNLFLANRPDGRQIVKVLDFGISKATVTGITTRTGDVMGSPAYMSPEQMQASRDTDARADVWSLGVVLYQLIGGVLPFSGATLPQLCLAVIDTTPAPLIEIRPDVPIALSNAVMRCLAKEPADRFADVGRLAATIAQFGSPELGAAVGRMRRMLDRRRLPSSVEELAGETHNMPAASAAAIVALAEAEGARTLGRPLRAASVVGTSEPRDLDVEFPSVGLTPSPPRRAAELGLTTMAGESVAIPQRRHRRRRRRRLVTAAIAVCAGALGVVGIGFAVGRGEPAAHTRAHAVTAPPPAPAPRPVVVVPIEPDAGVPDAAVAAEPVAAPSEPVKAKPRLKPKDKPKRAGSAADDDQWGHMTHDHPVTP